MKRTRNIIVFTGFVLLPGVAPAQDTIRVRADGPPAWGSNVRLVHEFTIGQLDGPPEYAFGRIDRLAADRSGGFYVFDGAETQIRRYDARGRFLNVIGRKGGAGRVPES